MESITTTALPSEICVVDTYTPRMRARHLRREQAAGQRPTRKRIDGPCNVYLLLHENQTRFKIGISGNTRKRAKDLPEADHIDYVHSVQVPFTTRARAVQIEAMLHKGLAGHNISIDVPNGEQWDGATEWFSMAGLPLAVELLQIVPAHPNSAQAAPLLTLKGEPYLGMHAPARVTLSPKQQRLMEAGAQNVQRMRHIAQVISMLSFHLQITWHPADGACQVKRRQAKAGHAGTKESIRNPSLSVAGKTQERPERLYIHKMRSAWTEELFSMRLEAMSDALWWLQTGLIQPAKARLSLACLIRYLPEQPDTMEIQIRDEAKIRRLPTGPRMIEMWRAMCSRLK